MSGLSVVPRFFVLSFEGPDRYALAGGLAIRVRDLTEALAHQRYETHLLFVGDPALPGLEKRPGLPLTWHRWCQWISAHHPVGVYDGEDGKVADFARSVPPYVLDAFVRPTLEAGGLPVILAEEWHTAEAVVRLDDALRSAGLRDRCVVFWNANNTMSFHRIDWARLRSAAVLTTVSHYMKHLMWRLGVNPVVIPNGIPTALLRPVDPARAAAVRRALDPEGDRVVLVKVGRYDPAKRWLMAVEAAARLRDRGRSVRLLMSGGVEPHRQEVMDLARRRGLTTRPVTVAGPEARTLPTLLAPAAGAELVELRGYLGQDALRLLYRSADAVLANSGHEPFGLVGLEAMAAGGIAFTGGTGEEYAFTPGAAVPIEGDDPDEIVEHALYYHDTPDAARAIRERARAHAASFTWERVTGVLLDEVMYESRHITAARRRGGRGAGPPEPARDVVIYLVAHQPRRLRLPAVPLPAGGTALELEPLVFDDELDERYFRKVASTCYGPVLERMPGLLERGLKLSIGFSGSFLDQAERWDPGLLDRFRRLVRHPGTELVAVEPTHSFVMLWDAERFVARMREAGDRLEALFGIRPRTADTTELLMSDVIYHGLAEAGYGVGFVDGRPWVLDGRPPTTVFHGGQRLRLLARHHSLSDDVGYRFSNRGWELWPLMSEQYASWLAGNPGDVVVLGWDFETFGEHHRAESGIFEFLDALPRAVTEAGMTFRTASEAVERHGARARPLPLPAFPATWAGSGGMEFFLGNPVQQAILQLMMQAHGKARLSGDPELEELALRLAQSDNLHLVQWYGRSGDEATVSAYFTPREWWALGADGIVWEIQQVYKNFIAAVDVRPGGGVGHDGALAPARTKGSGRWEAPGTAPPGKGKAGPPPATPLTRGR